MRKFIQFFLAILVIFCQLRGESPILKKNSCVGIPANFSPTYTMMFNPQPGQTLLYGFYCRMNSDLKSFFEKNLLLGLSVEGEINLSIKTSNKNIVSTSFMSPGIQINFEGTASNSTYNLSASREDAIEVVFDKAGRITDFKNIELLEAKNPLNVPFIDIFQICLPVFPNQQVSPGDMWSDMKLLSIPFLGINLKTKIEMKYTLKEVYPSVYGQEALVSVDLAVIQSGAGQWDSITGSLEGRGSGSGFLIIHLDKGFVSEYRIDYSLDGMMTAKSAEVKLMEQPFNSSFSISLNLLDSFQELK